MIGITGITRMTWMTNMTGMTGMTPRFGMTEGSGMVIAMTRMTNWLG